MLCADIEAPTSRNVTWLGVLRDIFFSFFGDLDNILPQRDWSLSALHHRTTVDRRAILATSSIYSQPPASDNNNMTNRKTAFAASSIYSEFSPIDDNVLEFITMYDSAEPEFAPGFETEIGVSMEVFHPVPSWRKTSNMIKIFLESTEMPFVLLDYHRQKYAKYAISGPSQERLQETLKHLANQQHFFIVSLEDNEIGIFSHEKAIVAAQPTRLILVGRRNILLSDQVSTPTQDSLFDWIDTSSKNG